MSDIILKNINDYTDILTKEDIRDIEDSIRRKLFGNWEFSASDDNFAGYGSFYEFEGEIMSIEKDGEDLVVWV